MQTFGALLQNVTISIKYVHAIFWAFLWKNWATFQSNIWSHWIWIRNLYLTLGTLYKTQLWMEQDLKNRTFEKIASARTNRHQPDNRFWHSIVPCQDLSTASNQAVWPDLAKFRHFSKTYLVFGQIWTYFSKKNYAIGRIFIIVNDQVKIRSHCKKQATVAEAATAVTNSHRYKLTTRKQTIACLFKTESSSSWRKNWRKLRVSSVRVLKHDRVVVAAVAVARRPLQVVN